MEGSDGQALYTFLRLEDEGNCAPLLLSRRSRRSAFVIVEFPTDRKVENISVRASHFEDGKEGQIETSQVTHMSLRCS